jgi:hypothetical protein
MLDVAALNKEEMLPGKWSPAATRPGQDPSRNGGAARRVAELLCGSPDGSLAQRVLRARVAPVTPESELATGAPMEIDVR